MEEVGVVPTKRAIVSALLGLAWVGCGGASEPSGAEQSSGSELAQYDGPITSTEVERGKEVFGVHCGDCHPDGGEDVGPSLVEDPHTPPQIRMQIREGSGKMRPFPAERLSDEDVEAILAYLATINAVK
jgi:mono/diheme cytochrome c family protein